jgi:hypothetical protein
VPYPLVPPLWGRAVEIARRIGDHAGERQCPVVAAGEAIEHVQGRRLLQLEHCAPPAGAAGYGRAVEIARRVGDQAGPGI